MKKLSKILLGIFTVLLTISFLLLLFTGIGEIRDVYYQYGNYDEEDYLYTLQQEDYVELVRMTSANDSIGESHTATIEACHAVAHYFESASLYKAYIEMKDQKNAKLHFEKMKKYKALTGEFINYIDKINDILEITH